MSAEKPALNILIVDDEEVIRTSLGGFLQKMDHRIEEAASGEEALEIVGKEDFDIILVDLKMPGMGGLELLKRLREIDPEISVIIITGFGTMETVIQALRLGASDFLNKPVNLQDLTAAVEKSSRLRALRIEQRQLRGAIGAIQRDFCSSEACGRIVGASVETLELRKQIMLAARSFCQNILITGETGTGKEVAAHSYHLLAHGRSNPFIAVNCPALPETLIESELFGHVRGSFTGATSDRLGAFELANDGTLFLDEISDLSPAAQAKLLRALETRKIRRVGAEKERQVNVTVVAASNQELEKLVKEKNFRKDLFFRLNVFRIKIKPLRDRQEDIIPLARHFLEKYCFQSGVDYRGITDEAEDILSRYHYPGNARELRNIIERAAILSECLPITPHHLTFPESFSQTSGTIPTAAPSPPSPSSGEQLSQEALDTLKALQNHKWNRRKAAAEMNITYEALRWRIRKHSLDELG